MISSNYRTPKIESDFIFFGDYTLPAHRVVKYNDTVVIEERDGTYYRWEFTDRNYFSPRWQCVGFASIWLTLL